LGPAAAGRRHRQNGNKNYCDDSLGAQWIL